MIFNLTFVYSKNYGAFLQAFALQYFCSKNEKSCFLSICKPAYVGPRLVKMFPLVWRFVALYKYLSFDAKHFLEFKNLPIENLRILKKELFPKFVVGSDQVWNPSFCQLREHYYFLEFYTKPCKKIAYAASLGVEKWPKEFEDRVLPLLEKFDAISVREESSVDYLKTLGLKNVISVCDPTILHKGEFYRRSFKLNCCGSFSSIFIYRIREAIPSAVEQVLKEMDGGSCRMKRVDLLQEKKRSSVAEWLNNIDNAKFVVTDSFHCAVFCILFHKSFIVLVNHGAGKGMNERFQTLLGKTELLYRILPQETTQKGVLERLNKPIVWDKVDSIMEKWRTYSANWLKKALEK